jgi:pyruvate dehydrogenase E1 component alpha subunit/2-oxoisovalerate dehydrogenase E1 component alpha subunit
VPEIVAGSLAESARRSGARANGPSGPAFAYFDGDDEARAFGLFRLVDEHGGHDPADLAWLDRELAVRLFRGMLTIRVMDARLLAIQRQGLISFYGEALGMEAGAVGSAAALAPEDWLVPALREAGAGVFRGLTLDSYVAQIFGDAEDVTRGRQMPCHPSDRAHHYVNMSSCVGSQIPHAVGIAMAMQRTGAQAVCLGFLGDGATSEGDFHVAINFAGVQKAPVVLVCQNNQWAISTPGAVQTAAPTIACKALGYGVSPLRADGNDVFAVYQTLRHAVERARRGDGPSFVELLTYRVSAHTSSDDPSRYRDEAVTKVWREVRDPLLRAGKLLAARGWLDEAAQAAMAAEIEAEVRRLIERHAKQPLPPLASLIEDVYERPSWNLVEQLAALAAGPRPPLPGHGK